MIVVVASRAVATWILEAGFCFQEEGRDWMSVKTITLKALVATGQQVQRREPIGTVGSTGFAKEGNLHFELKNHEQPPEVSLQPKPHIVLSQKAP